MPSEKLKRISLGIVGALILGVLFWFAFHPKPVARYYGVHYWNWEHLLGATLIAFILILGLYFIANILIEIFK